MASEYGVCAKISRVVFIILNLIFVLLGSALIGFGSYLINLGETHNYDQITGSEFVSFAALLVVAGCITFILASIGVLGAILWARPLLLIYVLVIVVIILLEIAGGILAFVYRDTITDEIEQRMNDTFTDYRYSPDDPGYQEDVNDAVAYVQETFECCGVNNSTDWVRYHQQMFSDNGNQPPRECLCDLDEDDNCMEFNVTISTAFFEQNVTYYAWDRGCVEVIEDNLREIAIGVGVVGIVVALIEIIGILLAIGLCVCVHMANTDTIV